MRRCLAVFSLALVVRFFYVAEFGQRAPLINDAKEYGSYALSVLDRMEYKSFDGRRASRMPGYPLFLTSVYGNFGINPLWTETIQAGIGALTCVLIFLIAADWLGEGWGLAAGVFSCFMYDLFAPSGFILTECLTTFYLTLFWWLWGLGSATVALPLAAAYFTRPEMAIYSGLLLLSEIRRSAKMILSMLTAFLFLMGGWTIRNHCVLGCPIPMTTTGNENVYLGIPRTVAERFHRLPDFLPPEKRGPLNAYGELASSESYSAAVKQLYHEAKTKDIIRSFFYNLAIQFYPFLPEYDPAILLLLPFWIWGMIVSIRDHKRLPVVLLMVYLMIVYSVVAVMQTRHRQVYASAMVLLAFAGAKDLYDRRIPLRFSAAWIGFNGILWACAPALRRLILR